MIYTVRELDHKTVYESKRFNLVEELYELPSGLETEHLTIEHPGAVVILPQRSAKSFLMVRQYRHSVRKTILEFPAGTLNRNETPFECAEREICEEIGYSAERWVPLGKLLPAPGFCNEVQHLFVGLDLRPKKLKGDDDELIEVEELTINEIEQAIGAGVINDAKSIAIFYRARIMGIF